MSPDAYARLCEDLRLHPGEGEEHEEFARAQVCADRVDALLAAVRQNGRYRRCS